MNTYFIYLAVILLIFLLIYYGIVFSLKFAPHKIRILSLSALIASCFRYIGLLVFLITGNIKNLYLLKPVMFLNILCIPVLGITSLYICSRSNKIKFNYCIGAASILLLAYAAAISKLPISIDIFNSLGYIMSFNNELLVCGIYLILNTIFFFIAVISLGSKLSNRLGTWFILFSAFAVMIEVIARFMGIIIFPALIIGDAIWLFTTDYALYKLKK
ncbi:hypothetical protein NBE98_00465 [Clostridium swellfunianum]|uniref:hypothetical protein n=1 Tax=Clostridium swellfunianum TaxID=1367462 RepID=UPI0020303712|nr:hypothetical protein [Clostridium swellfunianum]MCM0646843.1 hypothetical protein [Clostridium swellfunianum]